MPPLPAAIILVLAPLAPLFAHRVWLNIGKKVQCMRHLYAHMDGTLMGRDVEDPDHDTGRLS